MASSKSSKKNLVIVESPAKAKTISKYLNNNRSLQPFGRFIVMSSKGHIRDLKNKELSIDVEHNFEPTYEILKDKVTLVKELKEKAAQVDNVYLAADFDREGEAICQHLKDTLKLNKYRRITFTEITPSALEKAIKSPRNIDNDLVDAQETRRILDRLVGFKLSPLLWKTFNANRLNLSAGRVQSAVLHIITTKENDIKNHQTTPYYYFLGNFELTIKGEKHKLDDVRLYNDDKVYKIEGADAFDVAKKVISGLKRDFRIKEFKLRHLKQSPQLPFITSSLQQEAYSKLGFPVKRTMALAQDLYEKGYITYMRTDSYNMSAEFASDALAHIRKMYGPEYIGNKSNNDNKSSKKHAQEAHEAIRPTHVDTHQLDDKELTRDHKKLYDLIWKRAVAYFMSPALFDELEVKITDSGLKTSMHFSSSFKRLKFNGFLLVYGEKSSSNNDLDSMISAMKEHKYSIKEENVVAKNTWTTPPARYSEASIIKTLEAESIGRPSTFANILTKLFEKQYIMKSDIRGEDKQTKNIILEKGVLRVESATITVGDEKSKLIPSNIGVNVDEFLEENFAYIIDKHFTAAMEEDLDKIANGDTTRNQVLKTFWKTFSNDVEKIATIKKAAKVKLQNEELKYTIDGKEYIIRVAKYGPVVQYKQGEDTKYIDIKSYLKYTNKSYTSITEDDVIFLSNLPQKVAVVKGVPVMLTAGPYGLYFKYNGSNVKIPLKFIKKLLDPQAKENITETEYESIIFYKPLANGLTLKGDKTKRPSKKRT